MEKEKNPPLSADARVKTVLAFKALFEGDDEALRELRRIEEAERKPDLLDRLLESRFLFWVIVTVASAVVLSLIASFR